MKIDEQIVEFACETVSKYGTNHVFTTRQICDCLWNKYKTARDSVIPPDYCYNRVNYGIEIEKKPALFEYLGIGIYRCLGLNYPYNGVIYHKPKGETEIAVGKCVDGIRIIAPSDSERCSNNTKLKKEATDEKTGHKISRDPSMKLRFDVLKRDNFKCCACGASPAKDPSVELHVDHIIPWSKGGGTVFENLQTLCQACNLGKGAQL